MDANKPRYRIYFSGLKYNFDYSFEPLNDAAKKIGRLFMYADGTIRKGGYSITQNKWL